MNNSNTTKTSIPGHYNKASPCIVSLERKSLLSHPNSSKKTYHISLDISGTDLQFEPGDSVGILPQNDPILIERLLSLLSSGPEESMVDPRSLETIKANFYLSSKVNLARVNSSLLKHLLEKSVDPKKKETLTHLLDPANKSTLIEFLHGKDVLDVLHLFQETPSSIHELAPFFAPLLPRFYSISSSLKENPNKLDLLVALLSYSHGNELRYGVASHFLCHLAQEKTTSIPLYVQPALHFKLPQDLSEDLIMIGPGTGVAPYRAFLQERLALGATGRHWLFFGERERKYDFLYEDYWTSLEAQGKLKLDLAFSRDQEEKVYVQHKLLTHSKDIWDWLSKGASLYVCGDASKMAKDVEIALLSIFQKEGNLSEAEAKAHLKSLRHDKKYMTDVY
jgi:sulfite reductase (NADPH) flavoprotein alpha-component